MRNASAIRIEGVVTGTLPGDVYRVRFRNGHEIVGHLSKRDRQSGRFFSPGEKVTVELSPFDFSQGRIRLQNNLETEP